jgi:hypothetical protein
MMDDEKPLLPWFGNVDEWVGQWLRLTFRPMVDGVSAAWRARWWESPEAADRLTALWLAWEEARADTGSGLSWWWRDHFDHHMPLLLSPSGPLAGGRDHSAPGSLLPHVPAPPDLFPLVPHRAPCHAGLTVDDLEAAAGGPVAPGGGRPHVPSRR